MKEVLIYSKDGCGACEAAKAFMDSNSIDYKVLAVDKDKQLMSELIKYGVRSLPFIKIGETEIVGFDPSKILKAINK